MCSFGRLSILSFNGNKIIQSGGGALVSDNPRDISEAKFYPHKLKKINLFMNIKKQV